MPRVPASQRSPGSLATRESQWRTWASKHQGNYACRRCHTVAFCVGPNTAAMVCRTCHLPETVEHHEAIRAERVAEAAKRRRR